MNSRIYDITAEICSFIIKSCDEDFFVQYSCIAPGEKDRIHKMIFEKLPQLMTSDGKFRLLESDEVNEEFLGLLENFIISLKAAGDFNGCIGLVQAIDDSLEMILRDEVKNFQKDDFSVVMNSNRETVGIGLLPRCECWWERKRRLSHCYNRLDNFLFNLLLIENSILGELIDKHIFLKSDIFAHFETNKFLKVAATPLRRDTDFKVNVDDSKKVLMFYVETDESEDEGNNELVWKKICQARDNKADIIVFPEMMGNSQTESFIVQKINGLSDKEKAELPGMMILPSYWGKNRNTVSILDKRGHVLARQTKQNPFRGEYEGNGYLEGIIPSRVINIFHFEGIGRIAILICKDFITTKYMEQIMRCFKLTMIIVPSFSTGSYDFRQSFDICAHDDCNVVWINTCAAMQPGKESNFKQIGYVRKRVSRFDDESQELLEMKTCDGAFKNQCSRDCIFFEKIQCV